MSTAPDPPSPSIRPLAESALLVELGDTLDAATNRRALALAAALHDAGLAGLIDVVPAYTTVMVCFDPAATNGDAVAAAIDRLLPALDAVPLPERQRTIPVRYGGEEGPDLADVAAHAGLTPAEVVARHAGAAYRVACVGFCPGFAFLLGLPPELATPRRPTPRTRVPRGSVAIGGAQTGVYPLETPGGWNLIGRTDLALFDPAQPDPFYLRPGDGVRFVPVDGDETGRREDEETGRREDGARRAVDGSTGKPHDSRLTTDDSPSSRLPVSSSSRLVTVLAAGAETTIQDLGRPGLMHLGVSPGGALDRAALVLGNRLLGNDPGAAALEIALLGPRLRFEAEAVAVVTGADLGARLNGGEVERWHPVAVRPGDELAFVSPARPGQGLRAYLCLDGGIAVPPVMGSRATDRFAGIGGLAGRALRAGDALPLGPASPDPAAVLRRRLAGPPPAPWRPEPLRVVLGPQRHRFTDAGIATLLETAWTVTPRSDRIGLRLAGPPIALSAGADAISEGIPAGAIQVPGDGQPIVVTPARQTIGGYPKIAVVAGADLDRLGQRGPGDALRFVALDVAEARRLTLAARAAVGEGAVVEAARPVAGWAPPTDDDPVRDESVAEGGGWGLAAVERIVRVLAETGATRFKFELGGVAPLALEWERESAHRPPVAVGETGAGDGAADGAAEAGETIVTAPLLGVFYRRPTPDQPPFVEEGAAVAAGAPLGLIEVMKTYHEVAAPHAGTIAFLVEDGATVQFGQPVARLRRG